MARLAEDDVEKESGLRRENAFVHEALPECHTMLEVDSQQDDSCPAHGSNPDKSGAHPTEGAGRLWGKGRKIRLKDAAKYGHVTGSGVIRLHERASSFLPGYTLGRESLLCRAV
jgi:hypothetical protein